MRGKYRLILLAAVTVFLCRAYSPEALKAAAENGAWKDIATAIAEEPDAGLRAALELQAADLALHAGESAQAYRWLRDCLRLAPEVSMAPEAVQRARAMLEFILRSSADQVEVTLLLARSLKEEPDPGALLDLAALLLGRAEEWKRKSYTEWPELVKLLSNALDSFRDVGDPSLIFRHTLLQVNASNLQTGNYAAGAEKLQLFLRHHYPEALQLVRYRRELPYDACRLLIALSAQYAEMAQRANSPEDKKRYFGQAAGYLLNAVNGLPENSPDYERGCGELLRYQEALRLLGFELRLPEGILPAAAPTLAVLKDMLNRQQYQAAEIVIAGKLKQVSEPDQVAELQVLQIQALTGLKRDADIAAIAEQLSPELLSDQALSDLYQCAGTLQARRAAPESLQLLAKIIDSGRSSHPDYANALFLAARMALDCEQPGLAASFFEKYADALPDPEQRASFRHNAMVCYYRSGDYSRVREMAAGETPGATPEIRMRMRLLGARAALQSGDAAAALLELENMAATETEPTPETRSELLLLSGLTALKARDSEKACRYLECYIREFSAAPQVPEAAEALLGLYTVPPAEERLQQIADIIAQHHATRPGALPLLGKIAVFRKKHFDSGMALESYRRLASAASLPEELLLQALQDFRQEAFQSLPAQQAQMALVLTERLPTLADAPLLQELYFRRLDALVVLERYQEAQKLSDELLQRPNQYHFFEIKLLRALLFCGLQQFEQARRECQEILTMGAPAQPVRQAGLIIAKSWQMEGNHTRAVASAWNIIPPGGFNQLPPEEQETIRRGLQLIVECARQVSSRADLEDAEALLNQFAPAAAK